MQNIRKIVTAQGDLLQVQEYVNWAWQLLGEELSDPEVITACTATVGALFLGMASL